MRFVFPIITDRDFLLNTKVLKFEVLMAYLFLTRGSQIVFVINFFFILLALTLRGDYLNFFIPNFIFILLSRGYLTVLKQHFFPLLTLLLRSDSLILHLLIIRWPVKEANSRVLFPCRPQ